MGKWEIVHIGDAFLSINNGASIKQGDDAGSGLPITRIETISDGTINRDKMGYAGITDSSRYSNYILNTGDILMSHINSVKHLGKTAFYEKINGETIIHGMNLLRFQTNRSKLDSKYANYYFNSYDFRRQLPKITKNSVNQSSFNVKALKELSIPLPPLSVQQQIADALDRASALIEKRKAQIDKLDLMVKSQFIEMFGDPVTNPKGWEVHILGECCITNPKKKELESLPQNTVVSFVGMADVSETGDIDTAHLTTIEESKKSFTYFAENDVLFAKITPCMENGKGAIARVLHNGIAFGSTEFHVLRPINGVSSSEWLYYLTWLDFFRKQAEVNMTGSAGQKRVPISFIEQYKVPLPPISLQNDFAAFVHQVEAQKSLLQQSLAKLEQNYKSLMQKCFRGEIF